jgi:hypothetical protein
LSPRKAATAVVPDVWPRLVADYLLEKRAAGVSPRTTNHYKEVLEDVLLPFCEAEGIESPRELTTRHLNELGAGHLDGSRSRSGRALSKPTVHGYMRAINMFLVWVRKQGEGGGDQLMRLLASESPDKMSRPAGPPRSARPQSLDTRVPLVTAQEKHLA